MAAKKPVNDAWHVRTSKVPHALLQALPSFQAPPDALPASSSRLFSLLADAPGAPGTAVVDWRTSGALSPPAYQGPYNTCTSFAVVAAIEALHYLKMRTRIQLSAGFIHTCLLERDYSTGAGPREAVDAVCAHGVAYGFPGDYPFPPNQCIAKNLYPVRQRVRLTGANDAMLAIANHGPVVADMFVDPAFVNLPAGRIYSHQESPQSRLHTVCVVGYDQPEACWIIANSFGNRWGDAGFGRIAFGSGGLLDQRGGWQLIL